MPEQIQLSDVLKRALDANVQYYTTVTKLAAECFQALLGSIANLSSQQPGDSATARDETVKAKTSAPQETPVSTMVLEAEAGGRALGVFLVENGMPHDVNAPMLISAFVDSSGHEAHPPLKLDPEVIKLEPGEQVLVRVMVVIDENLKPGARYRGEISVPGLPGTRVPLVLQRRESAEAVAPSAPKTRAARSRPRANNKGQSQNSKLSRGRSRKA